MPSTFVVPAPARLPEPRATLHVEGDASSASYFLAAGVLGGGPVRVTGVGRDSIQGDVAFADVLARQGADIRFGADWIEARRGRAARRRHDRLHRDSRRRDDARDRRAVRAGADAPHEHRQLARQGNRPHRGDGDRARASSARRSPQAATGSRWRRSRASARATIDTYDDHRMAMCFSLAALGGAAGDDQRSRTACARRFPAYFDALASIARHD